MKEYTLTESRPMTVEEYIEFEEHSDVRHEFIQNQMISKPGTTRIHNTICFLFRNLLERMLKGKNYQIYSENVKVQIALGKDFTYPDLVVTNDPRGLNGEDAYFIKHPCLIVEVISKSSRLEDSTDKFIRYQNIESLQNYILVDSEKPHVEVRYKNPDGVWEADAYLLSDGSFPVPALGLNLDFADIYEGVSFTKFPQTTT